MPQIDFSDGATAQRIVDALYSAFPSRGELDQLVLVTLNWPAVNAHVDTAGNLKVVIFRLCQRARSRGELDDLVKGAHASNPGNPELAALHRKIFGGVVPGASPVKLYDRCLLSDDAVFFDRQPLRDELEGIDKHRIRRILVVTGEEYSGRSYTDKMIKQEAKEREYKTISLSLRGLPKEDPINGLAISLAGQMAPESFASRPPEQGTESNVRWAFHPLMAWILGWVRRATGTWWIIFDEFEKDLVDPSVYAFLVELAAKVEADIPGCRLAMLGFDQPIPPQWASKHRHEDIEEIEKVHLEHFFDGLYRQMGLEPDTATTQHLAQEFFDKYEAHKAKLAANAGVSVEDDPELVPARRFLNNELGRYASQRLDPPGA